MLKNAKRPRLKSMDELLGVGGAREAGTMIQNLELSRLRAYHKHPFKLYKDERLEDMIESVKANGVMLPIIVRKVDGNASDVDYEILSGHNRVNACLIAEKETVPAIILEGITEEEAQAYVIQTNLMQRSFTDMSHTEKAAVLAQHYEFMFSPGKRTDIIANLERLNQGLPLVDSMSWDSDAYNEMNSKGLAVNMDKSKNIILEMPGPDAKPWNSAKAVGDMYGMSRNTVSRYIRIHRELDAELKEMLDDGRIGLMQAETLSFLRNGKNGEKNEQHELSFILNEHPYVIDRKKADALRQASSEKPLNSDTIKSILEGRALTKPKRVPSIRISGDVYGNYFSESDSQEEIAAVVEKALQYYFTQGPGVNKTT